MRTLIDGYNLMYALGLMEPRFGPGGLHNARKRFLDRLTAALGPIEALATTVVFDAAPETAPKHPPETTHKGITVIFAVEDASADERIEHLIAHHAVPKTLMVVSSDLRIRQAATRRKAQTLSADDFLGILDTRRQRLRAAGPEPAPPPGPREQALSPEESAYWLQVFQQLAEEPEVLDALKALAPGPTLLTDAEIAALEREIAAEEDTPPRRG